MDKLDEILELLKEIRDYVKPPSIIFTDYSSPICNCNQYSNSAKSWWCPVHGYVAPHYAFTYTYDTNAGEEL